MVPTQSLPETLIEVPASMIPLFGRTQYRRGAVVLTLKHTFLSVGLESLRFVVTTSENGPARKIYKNNSSLSLDSSENIFSLAKYAHFIYYTMSSTMNNFHFN